MLLFTAATTSSPNTNADHNGDTDAARAKQRVSGSLDAPKIAYIHSQSSDRQRQAVNQLAGYPTHPAVKDSQ